MEATKTTPQMTRWLPVLAAAALLALSCGPVGPAEALSSGAPNSTCSSMLPRHRGSVPQSSPAPYAVTPSARQVARNGKMTVVLSSPQGLPIHGFMLQARIPGVEGAQGVFTAVPDTAKTINCDGIYASAVTHKDASRKNSLTFEWTAPSEDIKSIIFNATVVEDFQTYWTGVVSEEVQVVDHSEVTTDHSSGISTTRDPVKSTTEIPTPPPAKSVPRISDPTNPVYTGCGSTKACFGPNDCIDSGNCNIMVSVRVEEPEYEFEMFADGSAYVAVGLSDDNVMGDDSVVECTYNTSGNNLVEIFRSYNIPNQKSNQREANPKEGITLINGSYADGVIYCKFTRDVVTVVENKTFDLASTPYYLLIASGSRVTNTGIGFHDVNYDRTSSANYLSDVSGWTAASKVLLRLHGCFMIAAWIGTTSLGIVLARYFKQTWVGTQMCNKDIWFAWHRMLMLLTWVLTLAGFIIIFLELKDWSQESNPHAILGTITTILAFIQPIGAAFRPHPGSRKRPIFNWGHWLVGNVTHLLAIVTIFCSVQLGKAELPSWMDWVLVAYVAFYIVMHLILSIAGCVGDRQSNSRIDSFPMKDIASSRMPLQGADRKQDAPLSCLRKVILGIYILIILGFTIAIIVIVSLAPIEDSVESFQRWLSNS